MSWAGVIFKHEVLLSACGELSVVLATAWVVWGFPLVNNSIRCNSNQVLENLFGHKRLLVGTLSSPLFGDFLSIIFIYVYILIYYIFQETSIVLDFNTTPQMHLNFSHFSLYFLSLRTFHLITLLQLYTIHPQLSILFLFSNKVCFSQSFTLYLNSSFYIMQLGYHLFNSYRGI